MTNIQTYIHTYIHTHVLVSTPCSFSRLTQTVTLSLTEPVFVLLASGTSKSGNSKTLLWPRDGDGILRQALFDVNPPILGSHELHTSKEGSSECRLDVTSCVENGEKCDSCDWFRMLLLKLHGRYSTTHDLTAKREDWYIVSLLSRYYYDNHFRPLITNGRRNSKILQSCVLRKLVHGELCAKEGGLSLTLSLSLSGPQVTDGDQCGVDSDWICLYTRTHKRKVFIRKSTTCDLTNSMHTHKHTHTHIHTGDSSNGRHYLHMSVTSTGV